MSEELYRATVRITPDMTGFDEEVETKVEEATRPRDARGRFVKIKADVDTAEARQNVDGLKSHLDALSTRVATARANVDDREAQAKLLSINAQLLRIGERVTNPKIDVRGVAQAEAQLAALDLQLDKVGASGEKASRSMDKFGGGLSGIGVTTAALLPAMPALAGGIGALAGALTAAGAASIGFGAVFATGIHQATKANQELLAAQKTVNDSTNPQARQLALEKQAALIHQLGPATIAFGQALHDVSQAWTGFADSFIPLELQFVSGFEKLEKDVLPQLKPLISATFGVARDEIAHLDAAVNSPGGHSFFSWLAVEGPRDLRAITDGIGHFAAGFGHLLVAFTPVEHQLVDGFGRIGAKFAAATSGLDRNGGFQHFLATVEKDGPMLVHTLGDAASAVGHIGLALGPVLPLELKFIDGIARLVADHPAIAGALGAMFLGFQSLKVINTIVGPLSAVVGIAGSGAVRLFGFAAAEDAVAASGRGAAAAVGEGGMLGSLRKVAGFLLANPAVAAIIGGGLLLNHFSGGDNFGIGADHTDISNMTPDQQAQYFRTHVGLGLGNKIASQIEPYQYPVSIGPSNGSLDRSTEYSEQVPGTPTSAFGNSNNPDVTMARYMSEFNSNLNNPANMLPYSSGGSSAAAKAAQNNAAAAAYLLGISIPSSLAQGIAAGTNPLTATFQNLNLKLTGTAQTLANTLESTFTTALQYGQQVSGSLIPNVVNGLPRLGKSYTVTADKNGNLITREDSPILGGLQLTLANDQRFVADVGKAKKLGLNSTILGQFVQAGPSALSQLDQLVNSSPDEIAQINSVYGQITGLGNQFGYQQAMVQYQQQTNALLTQLLSALVSQVPPAIGHQISAALNNLARTAQLQASSTPSKGVLAR